MRHFKAVLKAADLPDIRLYDLRHTCASLLLAAGENPKVVSERLGHASVTLTLDTYSHVLPASGRPLLRSWRSLSLGVKAFSRRAGLILEESSKMGRTRGALTQAILRLLGDRALTYREIAAGLNESRVCISPDGLRLAVAQVRDNLRRHAVSFCIDGSTIPHRVRAICRVSAPK